MKKILLCIWGIVTLSGCHIYKAYERPDIAVSDSLYRQSVSVTDTTSLASLSWKELFTDPQLQQLIEIGLNNNTDLNIAYLKVKEAEALLMTSRLAYLPAISLTPQGSISSLDGAKATKTYDLAAAAEWEIDIFGKLLNAKRGAKAALEQSEAYRQANENVRAMKALKRAGQTTEMAVAQTEASKLSVDASVLSLEQQINAMENSLSVLLGMNPQEIGRSTLDTQVFPDSISAGVPLQLLSRRPDIRQSEAALAAAYYATNEARSAFYLRDNGYYLQSVRWCNPSLTGGKT